MSPDNGPPERESRDSAVAVQVLGAERPPLDDVISPGFEAWANGRSVPEHLNNARQLVELMDTALCKHPHCMHCRAIQVYTDGLRSRLAAIALRALPKTARAICAPDDRAGGDE